MTTLTPARPPSTGSEPESTRRWAPRPWLVRALLISAAVGSALALVWAARMLLMPDQRPAPLVELPAMVAGTWFFNFAHVMAMAAAAHVGRRWLPGPGPRRRYGLALLTLAAWAVNSALTLITIALSGPQHGFNAAYLPATLGPPLAIAALLVALEEFAERRESTARALHEAGVRNIALAREVSEAELSLLQAQIEPHFLFNTLANVRRLLRTDRHAAQALLTALLRYLEETLPRLRAQESSTLAREAELARAYLELHQVRMGARLAFSVNVPAALGAIEVPPLLLLTLVENAIKHGLAPQIGGGRIDVRTVPAADGRHIVLEVADTGRGMGNASGHGTGLANLRARLKALHGPAATLELRMNEPTGVVAMVTLPGGGPA